MPIRKTDSNKLRLITNYKNNQGKMEENNSLAKEAASNMKSMGKPPLSSLKLNLNSLNSKKSFFGLKNHVIVPTINTPIINTENKPQIYDKS